MNRRAARWLAPILIVLTATLGSAASAGTAAAAGVVGPAVTSNAVGTAPEPPPITANEFLPDDRNLSDCVGVLERPGCGSKERGGPMMTIVFALVIGGMAFVFWRVILGVRKNRAQLAESEAARSAADTTAADTTVTERTAGDPAEPIEP